MDEMLKEAKRLYDLGYAIHWLHSGSKRPIGDKWTTGPRKSWKELKESYVPGMNVGVRTGSASKLAGGYLACIDVDVKDPSYRKEAMAKVAGLIGFVELPEVRSGSGNGSRHLYCVTESPFKMVTVAKEKDKYEVVVYSEGRQMVLPPSIHPSGKPYVWKREGDVPLITFKFPEKEEPGVKRESASQETIEDFAIDESLDVRWLPDLPENIRSLIVSGVFYGRKIEDRSAHLLFAATALFSAGLDKNGVLTVLTDMSTFLGQCAYDHAQTKSRMRAAQWLWNYTVKRVMKERDPVQAFQGKAIVTAPTLDDEESEAQAKDLEDEIDWKQHLERTKDGKIRSTLNNLKWIITHVCETKTVVGRNEFALNDFYLCDTPWRSMKGDAITDIDIVRVKVFCCEQMGVEFPDNLINQALLDIADVNRFHPVRDYLKTLEWDGVPRIETWLQDFASASGPDEYLRAVSRKVLVALVKRVFEPGCKFDHVLILEGNQGVGKSTLLKNLVGDKWFTDQALVIGDKDAVLTMQSKWLIELGELASLNRSEVEQMKAFITQTTDRIRAPYGRRIEEYRRQCIFVGSTNLDEYLKDETGNRRFWPVKVGEIDFEGIVAVRDQLFAEAYSYYELREPLYLETRHLTALAHVEQEKRGEVDEWFGAVEDILNGEMFPRGGFEMRQLASKMDQFGTHKLDKSDQMRLAKILRNLDYQKFQEKGGSRRRLWRKIDVSNRSEPLRTMGGGSTKNVMISDFY